MQIAGIAYNSKGISKHSINNLIHLLRAAESFNKLTDFDEVIADIGRTVQSIMDVQTSSVMLFDEENNEFCQEYCISPGRQIGNESIPADEGIYGWVAFHKMSLIVNDAGRNSQEVSPFQREMHIDFE